MTARSGTRTKISGRFLSSWDGTTTRCSSSRRITERNLASHGGQGHGMSLYREVIHVPLLIYLPPVRKGPVDAIAAQVSTLDILPTIQDYLGLKRAKIWAGNSLLPLIGHDPGQKQPAGHLLPSPAEDRRPTRPVLRYRPFPKAGNSYAI